MISRADPSATVAAVPAVTEAVHHHARPESAARGGLQLGVATIASLVANYLFLLGAGRLLGSGDYGTLAALMGLLTVVMLPSGALQMAVSREIARRDALGEDAQAVEFLRALVRLAAKLTAGVIVLGLALVVPLRELLNLDATLPVALTMAALVGILLYPIALGTLQGDQRFRALAFVSAAPMVLRLGFFGVAVALGLQLYGALGAVALSSVVAPVIGWAANRDRLREPAGGNPPALLPFFRYLLPVAVGLFGVAMLTNIDILVVKARFPAGDAGVYGAASAFARVAFFLPGTILAVLFPRTAARNARGEQSLDILGRSLIVTVGFCAVLTGAYAVVGDRLVTSTFGPDFAAAGPLLVPFCVAMTLFSVVNVLTGYHLSLGSSRFAWIVGGAVFVQVALLATIPSTLRGMLWVDVLVGATLIVTHEVVVGSSSAAIVAGWRRLELAGVAARLLSHVRRRTSLVTELACATVVYALCSLVATWPLGLHLGDRLPGSFPNDGAGGAAWLWQLQHDGGFRLLGSTHHALTGAPLGWDQGNVLNFQWLLPFYPGYLLSQAFGATVALNLVSLSGLVLSGVAMYALVRYLGCGRIAAAWAGLVYIVFPWHLERMLAGHVTLVHLEFFPLVLLASLAWLRSPGPRRALAAALAVLASWLTSGYFGAMALVVILVVAGVGLVSLRAGRRLVDVVRLTIPFVLYSVLAAMSLGVVAVAAGGTGGIAIGHFADEIRLHGGHPTSYLPDALNPVSGSFAVAHLGRPVPAQPGSEGILYPGVLTVAFALIALLLAYRGHLKVRGGRTAVLALCAVTMAGILCAAPSPITVAGIRIGPMPAAWIFAVLPAFRVPTRFAAVIMLGLVPLAALALQHGLLVTRAGAAGWARRVAVGLACIAVGVVTVLDLTIWPFPLANVGTIPPAYAAVARTPPGVLAEYPLRSAEQSVGSDYLYWQQSHGRPLLNGANVGTAPDGVRKMLVDPAAPSRSGDARTTRGVRPPPAARRRARGCARGCPRGGGAATGRRRRRRASGARRR